MDYFTAARMEQWLDVYILPFGKNLILAIVIFLVGRFLAKLISRGVGHLLTRSKADKSLSKFLSDIAYAFLLAVVIIAALERLGVKTTAAIAILGAAGLAIGLAMQKSLGNFAAGVMLLVFRPFKVDDWVSIGGDVGRIDSVKLFYTVMITGDNRQLVIPNGNVYSGKIENLTVRGTRRIDMVFGISYDDDIKKAKKVMEEIVRADERVLEDPPPLVAVSELGDSSVDFVVRPWVKASDYWPVKFAMNENIKYALEENGCTIPFPQRDVHIHNEKPAVKAA